MEFKHDVSEKVVRVRSNDGGFVRQRTYAVKASEAIKKGDFLKLTSGAVVEPTVEQAISLSATPLTVTESSGTAAGLMGVALHDVTADASGNLASWQGGGQAMVAVALIQGNEFLLRTIDSAHDLDSDGSYSEVRDASVGTSYILGRKTDAVAGTGYYCATVTTTAGELRKVDNLSGQLLDDDYGLGWYRVVQNDTVVQV